MDKKPTKKMIVKGIVSKIHLTMGNVCNEDMHARLRTPNRITITTIELIRAKNFEQDLTRLITIPQDALLLLSIQLTIQH
jgi:hypothetical protein